MVNIYIINSKIVSFQIHQADSTNDHFVDFLTEFSSRIISYFFTIAPTLGIFVLDRYIYEKFNTYEYKFLYYTNIILVLFIEMGLFLLVFLRRESLNEFYTYIYIYIAVISPKLIYFLLIYPNNNKIKALLSNVKGLIRRQ